MQISRRDFLKKFAAMAAVGTMRFQPIQPVDVADDPEPEDKVEYQYGNHPCHLCQRDPRACDIMMYTCHKYYAIEEGRSVAIRRYDIETDDFVIVGEVRP